MTFVPSARRVLHDAQHVRNRLEDATDDREWRLNWVLAIILLRTVGDVLAKVDGAGSPRVKALSNSLYLEWRKADRDEHAIFRDLIKAERDSIVHEYATDMTEGPISVAVSGLEDDPADQTSHHLITDNLFRPMGGGRFLGEDGRDLIDEALAWWHHQLDEVDRRV